MKYQHPVKMLSYSARNIWLLIFPLLRGILTMKMSVNDIIDWVAGAWFDIVILFVILITGYVRWTFSRFKVTDCSIIYLNGIFARTRTTIPFSSITAVIAERDVYLRPFGAVRLYIETNAGAFRKSDLTIMVNVSDYYEIMEKISINYTETDYKYKPEWLKMFLFSLVFSSIFSGIIYVSAFLMQTGRLIQQYLQSEVFDTINNVSVTASQEIYKILAVKISPLAMGITIFVAACRLLSFIANIFHYTGFTLRKSGDVLRINTGILTKYSYYMQLDKVIYTDFCQSIMTKIFRVVSVNISCSGYNSGRSEIPVFMPMMSVVQAENSIRHIMPFLHITENMCRPKKTAIFKYIWQPIILAVLLTDVFMITQHYFEKVHEILWFMYIMLAIPIIWLLAVKLISLFLSGFSVCGDTFCIRYSRGYRFHNVIVDRSKIVKIKVTRTPWQKYRGLCDVIFFINDEKSSRHKVKSLSYDSLKNYI